MDDTVMTVFDTCHALCHALPHGNARAWLLLAHLCELLEAPDEARAARARAPSLAS